MGAAGGSAFNVLATAAGTILGGPAGATIGSTIGAIGKGVFERKEQRDLAKSEQQLLDTQTMMNQAQFDIATAEQQAAQATAFRKAISQQAARASVRGGGGSLVRQFGAESLSNFQQAQAGLDRGTQAMDLKSRMEFGQSRLAAFGQKRKADVGFLKTALEGINFSKLTGGAKDGK